VSGPGGTTGSSKVVEAKLWNIISGPWKYCAMLAFTQLEVADRLSDSAATTSELAARCHADPGALGRLLRCCASLGIVGFTPAGRWALTVEGAALREGGSMRAAVLANSGPPAWGAMLILGDAVRSGKPVFGPIAGKGFYDWHADEPDHGQIFQQFMTDRSKAAAEVIAGLDFGSATVVADIGGGYGSVIAAVLEAHQDLRGILLDRSDVLPGAGQWLAGRGLDGRCELVEGDYLGQGDIPAADVYLLGSILHNHDDDEARLILGNLIAEQSGARIISAEILLPGDPAVPHAGTDLDMRRLAIGGRERTLDEYTALLGTAGLTVSRVLSTASPLSVIDARHAVAGCESPLRALAPGCDRSPARPRPSGCAGSWRGGSKHEHARGRGRGCRDRTGHRVRLTGITVHRAAARFVARAAVPAVRDYQAPGWPCCRRKCCQPASCPDRSCGSSTCPFSSIAATETRAADDGSRVAKNTSPRSGRAATGERSTCSPLERWTRTRATCGSARTRTRRIPRSDPPV
jgi:hypothetical protein